MSGFFQSSWSENPNAPKISSQNYSEERGKFAGVTSCGIFYGIAFILFFQCIGALLDPANGTSGGTRRLLLAHTVAMFLFVTIYTAVNLQMQFATYIDNRGFPGIHGLPPGPLGFQYILYTRASGIISTVMFLLNNWLSDGLLLYRCWVIYTMNYWSIAFPGLMYLATIVTGILLLYYQISQPHTPIWRSSTINIGIPYSISVSLDVFLTVMIVGRLILLSKRLQRAMNAPFRIGGLYTAVITVVSESSALYAINFLLFIGTWATNHPSQFFFFPILAETQVIAPFLIVLRVANRQSFTSSIVTGGVSPSLPSTGSTSGGRIPSDGHSMTSTDTDGIPPEDLGAEVVMMVDLHHDKD